MLNIGVVWFYMIYAFVIISKRAIRNFLWGVEGVRFWMEID